jgi:DNA-binding transcriptional regulator YiaG
MKMIKRDIGMEILEDIQDIRAHKVGGKVLSTHSYERTHRASVISSKLNPSKAAFVSLIGISLRTVQDWEQGCELI